MEARKLTAVTATIPKVFDKLVIDSGPTPNTSSECPLCFGTGFETVDGYARKCACRLKRIRESLLAKIPPQFAACDLSTLQPLKTKHPNQASVIEQLRAEPTASYFFAGTPGTGKSLLMWALYRYAVEQGKTRVVACTLSELLDEYRAFIRASMNNESPKYPRLNADELRQTETRYSIFLDDIDKANPTDYAAEQIFNIVNAAYEFQHQLVVTTNKTIQGLIVHYDKSDSRGEPIVRRMTEAATIVEMF